MSYDPPARHPLHELKTDASVEGVLRGIKSPTAMLLDCYQPTEADIRYARSQQAYRDRIAARKARQRAGGA